MIIVEQKHFENDVLFSLLSDSANLLMRETLSPKELMLSEPERGGWKDQLVCDYLPIASKALPLEVCIAVPPSEGGTICRLLLPRQPVYDAARDFLTWFLQSSVDLGVVDSRALTVVSGSVMDGVADNVADMWKWIEL